MQIRQRVLTEIYDIYDAFSGSLDTACKPGCAACCTENVTVTTSEAYRVFQRLQVMDNPNLIADCIRKGAAVGYRPATTFNHMADLWAGGKDLPEEENHASLGKCPLLVDARCAVYPDRPFGCRCFVSKQDCTNKGWADVDPFVLTVNTVFLQFIEHIDRPGFTGTLTAMLAFFSCNDDHAQAFEKNTLLPGNPHLLPNHPISALMISPEHQNGVAPILNALQNIKIPRTV